ncbi:DNA topoisomerase IV, ATP/GTP binding site [Tribonema minus]|uniref:DNA topoisomerase (ATP-hydrolyzing) n=1 Tax=Tribonema minus TaxID=303371 RepID=A0A836CKD9_9STRA|nr:DNA topoisomerase IV, ATP/GTP binding site [Tribonema minus]
MQYAMSTILGRALPDVRDGLKPVHRRILYAMHGLGLQPESGYRKCARVVGEVLGKFHPHGDVAVYDALVRMAQDFVMAAPLIAGHGNFGSIDADPPAAMRYTESKLAPVARDALLADVAMDTVDFVPNFDGNEQEPVVLPARLPILLLNGATGIAVGMATNIPPHNLGELTDACVALIKDPELPEADLFKIVPAPDFPSGGTIMGLAGARKMYTTSNGSVTLRATTHIESIAQRTRPPRNAVIVTEMPYMVNKAALLEKIAALVNEKKLDGIADLRDESDRDGIRVVIELKRDAVPQVVQNNLYKKTQLQTSFSGNMLAIGADGLQPQRFTLRALLDSFLAFRFKTVRRRTAYELAKVQARDHIVEGMLIALARVEEVIELVRGSKDNATARQHLTNKDFGLSTEQADAVLALRLGRLTKAEEIKLKKEHTDLTKEIKRLLGLMQDDESVRQVMVKELLELKAKHAVPRRSIIKKDEGELNDEDLLANDNSIIVITRSGYIKRMPLEEFQAQRRGTRGKAGAKLSDPGDEVAQFFTCRDHNTVLFVSDRGVAYGLRAFQVPTASRTAKGVPVPQVLPLSADERISSVIPVEEFKDDEYLVLLTKRGWIKKTSLAAFQSLTARGLTIISLEDGDELLWVKTCTEADSIIIGTQQGMAVRFAASADQLRPSGRTSRGVKAMKFKPGDYPVDIDILPGADDQELPDGKSLVAVTVQGYGKRVGADEFKIQRRGGMGVIATKFKTKRGAAQDALCALRVIANGDQLLLSTAQGTIVRQPAATVSEQGRTATGVRVQKLDEGDEIASIAVVHEDFLEGEDADEGAAPTPTAEAVEVA